ncbi:MAG: serpin family protein [Eubacterium sp.]
MKKRYFAGLALTLLALTLTACAQTGAPDKGANTPETSPAMVNTAYQKFSAELFTQAVAKGKQNPVISPASAYLVLGMTANGAADDTAAAFKTVLGMDTEALNTYNANLMKSLQETSGDTTFNLANSIWLNTGYTPKESFIQTAKTTYGAAVFEENLSTAQKTINTWVSEKTNAMIPDFLDQAPSQDMRMLLINTLYMKAFWANPFTPELTADAYTGGRQLHYGSFYEQ